MADGAQSPSFSTVQAAGPSVDRSGRIAGVLLLLTAAATVAMVAARVAADADQATLVESLQAVAESRAVYGVSGIARFLSGVTLIAAASFLLLTWIIRERFATPWVPYLFALSGTCTAVSGAGALLIAVHPEPELVYANGVATVEVAKAVEVVSDLRWVTGKVGFTLAGAALVIAARYQWQVGGMLRVIAPLSALLGVAMQFIWLDAATVVHRVVGVAFFLWLLAVGTMLATGRVERLFIATFGRDLGSRST